VGTPAFSVDFQKGLTAYESGDYATALREWTPIAEQWGVAVAQYGLGRLYDKGRGVPQDYKTAVKWYRLAARQGHTDAQHNLGQMYRKGEGVPQDYKTAVKWYRLAAEQGDANAQNNLKNIKSRLVSKGIDDCLFDEIAKVTGPETKKIVEKYCRNKLEKKSLD
jgi:TPR repeat protein